MDPGQRRLAERRLLSALARFHRREPMAVDLRIDGLLALLREDDRRPVSHRGAAPLDLTDAELFDVLDGLQSRGEVERDGHRVRVAGHRPQLGPEMRRRADALLTELGTTAASPPRAEPLARRLGLPDGVLDALRQSGELVQLAPGVEYPRDVLADLLSRLRGRGLTVAQVRDELGTSRRYAAPLLEAAEREDAAVRG
jgi:hypothetical protein